MDASNDNDDNDDDGGSSTNDGASSAPSSPLVRCEDHPETLVPIVVGAGKRRRRGTTARSSTAGYRSSTAGHRSSTAGAADLRLPQRLRDALLMSTNTSSPALAMTRLAREIGEILHDAGISDDTLQDYERRTTGFLEDLALHACLLVDRVFDGSRGVARRVLTARRDDGVWGVHRSLASELGGLLAAVGSPGHQPPQQQQPPPQQQEQQQQAVLAAAAAAIAGFGATWLSRAGAMIVSPPSLAGLAGFAAAGGGGAGGTTAAWLARLDPTGLMLQQLFSSLAGSGTGGADGAGSTNGAGGAVTSLASSMAAGLAQRLNPAAYAADSLTRSLDMRSIADVVHDAGYPFETHAAVTDDGYILSLDRIPRRGSSDVLFLQHGVVDSSFAWVANGPDCSLGYEAYQNGADVFMGNFRGTGERAHVDASRSEADYWRFTVNDHAYSDLPALLAKVAEIKAAEWRQDHGGGECGGGECGCDCHRSSSSSSTNDPSSPSSPSTQHHCRSFTLTIAAHSMGGAATTMYLVKCGTDGRRPAVDRAVLLSPAGVHLEAPLLCRATGPVIDLTVSNWISSFRYPSNLARSLAAKVIQDVKNVPALQDLMAVLAAMLLGGDTEQRNFFRQVDNLTYHSLAGTSSGIFKHFWQIYSSRSFRAYDHGSAEANVAAYGTAEPPDVLAGFEHISVPCHFLVGLRDNLIAPANVLAQYERLRSVRPALAHLKVFPGLGHVDFTYGNNQDSNAHVLEIVRRAARARDRERRGKQQQQQQQ
jgi:hypothetical protein